MAGLPNRVMHTLQQLDHRPIHKAPPDLDHTTLNAFIILCPKVSCFGI
jgi:hypothetical protein